MTYHKEQAPAQYARLGDDLANEPTNPGEKPDAVEAHEDRRVGVGAEENTALGADILEFGFTRLGVSRA